eukprot:252007-Pleurochrysis_carterae.AAC.1
MRLRGRSVAKLGRCRPTPKTTSLCMGAAHLWKARAPSRASAAAANRLRKREGRRQDREIRELHQKANRGQHMSIVLASGRIKPYAVTCKQASLARKKSDCEREIEGG